MNELFLLPKKLFLWQEIRSFRNLEILLEFEELFEIFWTNRDVSRRTQKGRNGKFIRPLFLPFSFHFLILGTLVGMEETLPRNENKSSR